MSNGKTLVVYFSRADENYNVGTVEVGNTELPPARPGTATLLPSGPLSSLG